MSPPSKASGQKRGKKEMAAPRRAPAEPVEGRPGWSTSRVARASPPPPTASTTMSTPPESPTHVSGPASTTFALAALPTADGLGATMTMRARPRPAGASSAVVTLAWRAMLKIKHVPFQLFDVTIMPIMFTLLFTFMFGGALAGSPKEYIQFLLPGILVQTIIFITVYTGVGLNTDITKGLFDRFRSLPMWQPAPLLGALTGDLFRYTVTSLVILTMGFILGFRPDGGVLGVLLAFLLVLVFALALSWIWIIFGMKVKTPESVMTTSFIFLMPLTFASNIFVGLETIKPAWLRTVVENNPVTHLATASRALMHGQSVGDHVAWALGWSAGIVLVAAPIAFWLYRKER